MSGIRASLGISRFAFPLVASLLVPALAHAECTKDVECKGDRICTGGLCVAPAATTAPPAAVPAAPAAPAAPVAPASPGVAAAPPGAVAPPGFAFAPAPGTMVLVPVPPRQPAKERASKGVFATGIVLTALAPVPVATAVALGVIQGDNHNPDTNHDFDVPMVVLSVAGGLFLVGGIVMMVVGGRKVPVEPESALVVPVPWASRDAGGVAFGGAF